MNVKMKLDGLYLFSVSQDQIVDKDNLVEVALFCGDQFVPCKYWATNWVGEDYDDDVIRNLDGMEVLDLLCYAKNYVYREPNDHEA